MSRDRARALHEQGVSRREIAQRLGVSVATVMAWLRRPPTFPARACLSCGERFTPTNGRQRFCTPEHWEQQRNGGPKLRECRLCGRAFAPTGGRQRFCTPEHRDQYRRRHGPPTSTAGWRERVERLEAEIARVRAQLTRDREAR
jgi:hypothetical protein